MSPVDFWNNILWTDETKIQLSPEKIEDFGEGKELFMIRSITPDL